MINFSKIQSTQERLNRPKKLSIETQSLFNWKQEWKKLKSREKKNSEVLLTPIQRKERETLWFQIIKDLLKNLGASDETFFTAIQIYDNFILKKKLRRQHLKKLCLAIMDLAIKLCEPKAKAFPILRFYAHFNIEDPSDLTYLQKIVLESFNFDLNFVSEWGFLDFYLRASSQFLNHLVENWEKKKLILRKKLKKILIFVKKSPSVYSGLKLDETAALIFSAGVQQVGLGGNFLSGFCQLMGFGFRECVIEGGNLLRVKIGSSGKFEGVMGKNCAKKFSRVVTQDS